MVSPEQPHFAELRHLPRASWPDPSVVPPWLYFVDDTGSGLWRVLNGVWIPVTGKVLLSSLSGPLTTFDFQSIPQIFKQLEILASIRTDRAAAGDQVYIALNNDTTNANYDGQYVAAAGATVAAAESLAGASSRLVAQVTAASATTDHFTSVRIRINNPLSTKRKLVTSEVAYWVNRAANGLTIYHHAVGWANTSAINRVTLLPSVGPNFIAGSYASLYGVV